MNAGRRGECYMGSVGCRGYRGVDDLLGAHEILIERLPIGSGPGRAGGLDADLEAGRRGDAPAGQGRRLAAAPGLLVATDIRLRSLQIRPGVDYLHGIGRDRGLHRPERRLLRRVDMLTSAQRHRFLLTSSVSVSVR